MILLEYIVYLSLGCRRRGLRDRLLIRYDYLPYGRRQRDNDLSDGPYRDHLCRAEGRTGRADGLNGPGDRHLGTEEAGKELHIYV